MEKWIGDGWICYDRADGSEVHPSPNMPEGERPAPKSKSQKVRPKSNYQARVDDGWKNLMKDFKVLKSAHPKIYRAGIAIVMIVVGLFIIWFVSLF